MQRFSNERAQHYPLARWLTNETRRRSHLYLGGVLTKQVNIASEISSRIASAMATCKSRDIFWKEAQCSLRNKILIYNAVIKSKLLYALETLEIPTSLLSRLEAFQLKGLRKIWEWVPRI